MIDLSIYDCDQAVAKAYLESLQAHIRHVQEAAHKLGLGVPEAQLAVHDQSKFSVEEFPGYARHFHGGGDPDGFARAWLHHLHHNCHHWQHWIFPDGFNPSGSSVENGVVRMPNHYALEMIADWHGASMAYTGSWDIIGWLHTNMPKIRVHSLTANYLRDVLDMMGYADVVYMQRFAQEES